VIIVPPRCRPTASNFVRVFGAWRIAFMVFNALLAMDGGVHNRDRVLQRAEQPCWRRNPPSFLLDD